jgi:hypothetical protein
MIREIAGISFDELVEYGKANGANIVNDMPWSFDYKGMSVTHENDRCYLICPPGRTLRFQPGEILVTGSDIDPVVLPAKADARDG